MNKSIAAFFATVAVALAAAANQPVQLAPPIGMEASAGWTVICQDRT